MYPKSQMGGAETMFSQNREEMYILNYFNRRGGSLCSIGENDGVTFSNARALLLRGWSGVLIEASPKAFEKLKHHTNLIRNENVYPVNIALTNYDGEMVLQESGSILPGKEDIALVSTIHLHEMNRFKSVTKYNPVTVKCCTWRTFLYESPIKQFDFISIDIEGEELNVLPDMDFDAMETKMVCIEWNSKPELKKEYDKYLSKFNVIYTSAENLIYAR